MDSNGDEGEEAGMSRKVIIDCDVGVDDALALILAFHSPEVEVQAITGVSGNVPLDLVFVNIQKVLSLIQPPFRPLIVRGAAGPLKGIPVYAYSFHGEDGLGGAEIARKEGEDHWPCNRRGPSCSSSMATKRPVRLSSAIRLGASGAGGVLSSP